MGKVPKLRFEGFTGEWEEKKLGELVTIISGEAPSKFKKGTYPYIKVDDLNNNTKTVVHTQNTVEYNPSIRVVKKNSVVFPKRGAAILTNKVRLVGSDSYMDTNMMALVANETNSEFLYSLITREGLYKIADTSTIPQINNKHIEPYKIIVPGNEEQRVIGALLSNMDTLLTLHQRKYDALLKAKQFYLQNLFPRKGEKTPRLRFAGFSEEWKEKKLGEIVERVTRKNQDLESELPLTISAQYGLIDQNEFFDRRIASKDVSGYYLIRNGEFAYNKSTSTDAPWGAIKRLDKYEKGVLSTLYIVFRIIDDAKVYSDYLVSYYDTNIWHKDIVGISAEGARNHGLLNIAPSDFFNTRIVLPQYEEQRAIGNFLSNLDHLITTQQRKLETLKRLKQFMLQNLFV